MIILVVKEYFGEMFLFGVLSRHEISLWGTLGLFFLQRSESLTQIIFIVVYVELPILSWNCPKVLEVHVGNPIDLTGTAARCLSSAGGFSSRRHGQGALAHPWPYRLAPVSLRASLMDLQRPS